jgi:hypothetical protein
MENRDLGVKDSNPEVHIVLFAKVAQGSEAVDKLMLVC